jgi:hypothetical protein
VCRGRGTHRRRQKSPCHARATGQDRTRPEVVRATRRPPGRPHPAHARDVDLSLRSDAEPSQAKRRPVAVLVHTGPGRVWSPPTRASRGAATTAARGGCIRQTLQTRTPLVVSRSKKGKKYKHEPLSDHLAQPTAGPGSGAAASPGPSLCPRASPWTQPHRTGGVRRGCVARGVL